MDSWDSDGISCEFPFDVCDASWLGYWSLHHHRSREDLARTFSHHHSVLFPKGLEKRGCHSWEFLSLILHHDRCYGSTASSNHRWYLSLLLDILSEADTREMSDLWAIPDGQYMGHSRCRTRYHQFRVPDSRYQSMTFLFSPIASVLDTQYMHTILPLSLYAEIL